jgi:hypothetical protein
MHLQLQIFLANLRLTTISVAIYILAGFLLSFPVNAVLHSEATSFKLGTLKGIETRKLEAYEETQRFIVMVAAVIGAAAAQVVFVLSYRKEKPDAA